MQYQFSWKVSEWDIELNSADFKPSVNDFKPATPLNDISKASSSANRTLYSSLGAFCLGDGPKLWQLTEEIKYDPVFKLSPFISFKHVFQCIQSIHSTLICLQISFKSYLEF